MHTVLVTGGEGFAGSRLVSHLSASGHEVVAGVRNRARKLAYERRGGKALVCDVTDAINVARVVASVRPDGVVHLAGVARSSDAAAEPLEAYQSIVTAWANILDAVRRCVPRARVVLASSYEVYGEAGQDGHPLSESVLAQPVSTFGSLKRAAEDIAATFYRDYRLNVTVARPFPYTGPGQSGRFYYSGIAQRLAAWEPAVHGNELRVPGLDCPSDILHVEDVVSAYERLLADGRPNETYNICSGQGVTAREVVTFMMEELGLTLSLQEPPETAAQPRRLALVGNNSKLKSELGWQPTRSPWDAIRDLVRSLRTAAQPAAT